MKNIFKTLLASFILTFAVNLDAQKLKQFVKLECVCDSELKPNNKGGGYTLTNIQGINVLDAGGRLIRYIPAEWRDISATDYEVTVNGNDFVRTSIIDFDSNFADCLKSGSAATLPEHSHSVADIPDFLENIKCDSTSITVNEAGEIVFNQITTDGNGEVLTEINNVLPSAPIDTWTVQQGDTSWTFVQGELGTLDSTFVIETHTVDTNLVDNQIYFIETNCSELGVCSTDTTGCKPLPPVIIGSVSDDIYTVSCDSMFINPLENDVPCYDVVTGEQVVQNFTPIRYDTTCFESLTWDIEGFGLSVKFSDCGLMQDCEIDYINSCGDTATITLINVPEAKGSVRVDKEFLVLVDGKLLPAENTESGDQILVRINLCASSPIGGFNPDGTPIGAVALPQALDDMPSCLGNPIFFSGTSTQGSGIVTSANMTLVGGDVLFNTGLPALQPADCHTLIFATEVICPSGFSSISNFVTASGDGDGDGVIGDTEDYDVDVINEVDLPVATLDWGSPNNNTGIVQTSSQSYIKSPSGALIDCGEPFRLEFRLCDGTLHETITGTLCGSDYVSDRTDGLSITNFSATGDFGNALTFGFDLFDWAFAVYGNLTDVCNPVSTFFVGGAPSVNCPIESEGYESDICLNCKSIFTSDNHTDRLGGVGELGSMNIILDNTASSPTPTYPDFYGSASGSINPDPRIEWTITDIEWCGVSCGNLSIPVPPQPLRSLNASWANQGLLPELASYTGLPSSFTFHPFVNANYNVAPPEGGLHLNGNYFVVQAPCDCENIRIEIISPRGSIAEFIFVQNKIPTCSEPPVPNSSCK